MSFFFLEVIISLISFVTKLWWVFLLFFAGVIAVALYNSSNKRSKADPAKKPPMTTDTTPQNTVIIQPPKSATPSEYNGTVNNFATSSANQYADLTKKTIRVEIEGVEVVFRCHPEELIFIQRQVQLYADSLQIIYKSKNIETVISRTSVCLDCCISLGRQYGFREQGEVLVDILENLSRQCYVKLIDEKLTSAIERLQKAKTDKGKYAILLRFTGWLQKYQEQLPEDIVDEMLKKLMIEAGVKGVSK